MRNISLEKLISKSLAVAAAFFVAVFFLPHGFCAGTSEPRLEVRDAERYYMRLKNIKQREPDNIEIIYELANYQYSIRSWDEAIREYKRVLELNPEHESAKYFLSKCLTKKGYHEDAFWLVRDLIIRHKKNPDLYEYAGELLLKMNESAAASEYFARYDELVLNKKPSEKFNSLSRPNMGQWKEMFYR